MRANPLIKNELKQLCVLHIIFTTINIHDDSICINFCEHLFVIYDCVDKFKIPWTQYYYYFFF